MLDMIERHKRGGLCFVGSKRYVQANNKYLDNYDKSKPSTFIMYWDANNLYAFAMSQCLPYKDLKLYNDITLDRILNLSDDSEQGCIVECDLHFPRHLHDKFKELPPAPETLTPNIEWFSNYQKCIGRNIEVVKGDKYNGCEKLVPHLYDHKNYVIHY